MKVRIQSKGLCPIQIIENVQSIVVYDDNDNPAYVSQQIDPFTLAHEKAGYAGFEKLLSTMGIGLNKPYRVVKLND